MLINIIGSPHSGKTTLAAKLFDHFKTDDLASEFITERARHYIVEKRCLGNLKPKQRLYLTDDDQMQIMKQQLSLEGSYVFACPRETCIISDSSPLNSLWYMEEQTRNRPEVQKMIEEALQMQPLVFWARAIPGSNSLDVNRIHDPGFCLEVDKKIPELLQKYVPNLAITEVRGDASSRYRQVLTRLLQEFLSP